MSNKPQMVTGFNHNIKHNGQIFHVQTEDSGAANPHIITHLFVGGNILATKKTSYADIVHADNLFDIVRELMQEQHKAMLRNLINGVYDNIASSSAGPMVPEPAPQAAQQAGQQAALSEPPPVTLTPKALPPKPAAPPATSPAAAQPAAVLEAGKFPPPAGQQPQAASTQTQPAAKAASETTGSAGGFARPKTGTKIHRPPAPERAPATAVPAAKRPTTKVTLRPASSQTQEAPSGAGATQPAQASQASAAAQAQPTQAAQPAQAVPQSPAASEAPTVPAMPAAVQPAVAANADIPPEVLAAQRLAEKPKPKNTAGPTIFGENLISEKSLDEVILGYLAGSEDGGG